MPVVSHISDTALWIAAIRARESKRPDAMFRDPLAERLAGDRGRRIAKQLSGSFHSDWPIAVRIRLIDDLVASSLAEGADRVINLAAGLDTRPFRLPLPGSLTWIEADLPALVDEKQQLLAGEQPRCQLVREKVDLADPVARASFLDRATDGAQRVLVITEGLLVYLEPEQVRAIARDIRARDAIAWWIIDLASPRILQLMKRRYRNKLGDGVAMKFAPEEGVGFFRPLGWRARDIRSFFREAARFDRLPWYLRPFARLPEANPERLGRRPWGAVVRFERG
jgi:methyltransferase (TIGR00027 family)